MTARTVRWNRPCGGGSRGLLRALVIVFAALVVLVHHQTAVVADTGSAPSAATATQGMAHTPGMAMPTGSAAVPAEHTATGSDAGPAEARWDAPAHGPCASAGTQHCSPAGIDAVKLAPPPSSPAERAPDPYVVVSHRMAAAAAQRAPPDLSALSRLLI